jgi:hypothetical protein
MTNNDVEYEIDQLDNKVSEKLEIIDDYFGPGK